MKIHISTIPYNKMRYPTGGDWQFKKDGLHVSAAKLGNEDWEFLCAWHELCEAWLCKKNRIKEKDVDRFDIAFEKKRKEGDNSEPGDDPNAPYWLEHQIASGFERMMAAELFVDWQKYNDSFLNL